jgi:hypothetical protein
LLFWKFGLWAAVYLVAFGGFAVVAARGCQGVRLTAVLTFMECAALAAVVPLFAVGRDPRRFGVLAFLRRLGLIVLVLSRSARWCCWLPTGCSVRRGSRGRCLRSS